MLRAIGKQGRIAIKRVRRRTARSEWRAIHEQANIDQSFIIESIHLNKLAPGYSDQPVCIAAYLGIKEADSGRRRIRRAGHHTFNDIDSASDVESSPSVAWIPSRRAKIIRGHFQDRVYLRRCEVRLDRQHQADSSRHQRSRE